MPLSDDVKELKRKCREKAEPEMGFNMTRCLLYFSNIFYACECVCVCLCVCVCVYLVVSIVRMHSLEEEFGCPALSLSCFLL